MPRQGSSLAVLTAICGFAITLPTERTARADAAGDAVADAKEATELATAGEYARAATKFRSAYAHDPLPEYLCNVGVAYQRAKDLPRASLYLNECLVRGTALDATFVGLVKKALTAAEDTMRTGEFAPLAITIAPETASLALSGWDADEKFVGSRTIWVPFGTYTLTVSGDGFTTATKSLEVNARIRQDIHIELAKPAPIVPVKAPPPKPAHHPSKAPAIVASVLTVGAAVTAIVFYVSARSRIKDAGATDITREQYDDIIDDARGKQHVSWVFGGVAGAGAIATSYLWYRYAKSPTTVEVSMTSDGAFVGLAGAW